MVLPRVGADGVRAENTDDEDNTDGGEGREEATSPRVKRTIPATRTATESPPSSCILPTMRTEKAITGTILADLSQYGGVVEVGKA